MKTYKINIPSPCTEDWDQMTQTDKGKHCASCNKVVIDFSNMSNQEVMEILLQHKGKKVCGNFYNTQIENPVHYIAPQKHIKWPAIAAMLVAGIFQLMPMNLQAQKEPNAKLHSSSLSIIRNDEQKEQVNTEPGKDSVLTYTIKILSKENKTPIVSATVTIDQVGTFVSDKNGMITFTIEENKIPEKILIELTASGFNYESITIDKKKISRSKNIELFMTEREKYMLRGDVSYDDMH